MTHAVRSARASFAWSLAAALGVAIASPTLYAQVRLAVIDMSRAVRESGAGQRAMRELRAMFDARQAELERRQEALRREREELERLRNGVMPVQEWERRSGEFQTRLASLQQTFQRFQQELQERESQLTKRIQGDLTDVVRRQASAQKIAVVVERASIVFTDPAHPAPPDITDAVMRAYDTEHPSP